MKAQVREKSKGTLKKKANFSDLLPFRFQCITSALAVENLLFQEETRIFAALGRSLPSQKERPFSLSCCKIQFFRAGFGRVEKNFKSFSVDPGGWQEEGDIPAFLAAKGKKLLKFIPSCAHK